MPRKQLERVLVIDSDSSVYACGFMSQRKVHFILHNDKVVYTNNKKLECNKWAKTQTDYPVDELIWDFNEELDPVSKCLDGVRKWIANQFEFSGCHRYILLLTKGGNDFRMRMATIQRYKGNRLKSVKPTHYDAIRTYMKKYHAAKMYAKWEADDTACMIMHKGAKDADTQYILSAIDKDLYQMPCLHVNPNKKDEGVYPVSEVEGWHAFYIQMLMGDTADNIKSLSGTKEHPGVGPKAAEKILDGCDTVEQMCEAVWKAYQDKYPEPFKLTPWWWSGEWEDDDEDMLEQRATKGRKRKTITVDAQYMFRETADLLYMLRYPEDQYVPHIKFKNWKPYPKGIVHHVLGD